MSALTQTLADLRAAAHGGSRLERPHAIRRALPMAARDDDAGAVVRDYLRDLMRVEVTAAQAAELRHICGEARWLACAWQAAEMRGVGAAERDADPAPADDRLMTAIEAIWTDADPLLSEGWMREGAGAGVGVKLYDPRASNAPPPLSYRDRRRWSGREARRWQYKIIRRVGAPEWTALTVEADGGDGVLAEAPYLEHVRVGPTLRGALLGEPSDRLREPSQVTAHIRAAVAALATTEAAGRGWLSARLDLGDDAMRRLARLLRREEEV